MFLVHDHALFVWGVHVSGPCKRWQGSGAVFKESLPPAALPGRTRRARWPLAFVVPAYNTVCNLQARMDETVLPLTTKDPRERAAGLHLVGH